MRYHARLRQGECRECADGKEANQPVSHALEDD
jgi:hypothetical protein